MAKQVEHRAKKRRGTWRVEYRQFKLIFRAKWRDTGARFNTKREAQHYAHTQDMTAANA